MFKGNPTFLFNDYFYDPRDEGVRIIVDFKEKHIPFRIKRTLTLKERQQAQSAAIKIDFDKRGQPTVTKLDQAAYTSGVVLAALKWWPFTYPPDYEVTKLAGRPVPINRETVDALDAGLNDLIANKVLGLEEVQKAALDPFARKSDGD